MKIRLDSARFEPFRWQERVAVAAAEVAQPNVEAVDPVEVDGTLSFADPNFWLEMRLQARARLVCDRCLEPFEQTVSSRLELAVAERPERRGGTGERELSQDELGLVEVEGEILDTGPLVREQIVLDLPVKPLCKADCAGLCPRCGANRNLGECGCGEPAPDPRWAALTALRDKLDDRA